MKQSTRELAILGGGPAGMFLLKRIVDSGRTDFRIYIFEKSGQLGAGMPYSDEGANDEHVTNVSDNEIPNIVTPISEWVKTAPPALLERFDINADNFNEYKVLPRLFFGEYLAAQFDILLRLAAQSGIEVVVRLQCAVDDISDNVVAQKVTVKLSDGTVQDFDHVAICTGHSWPKINEGKIPGYFDSPYPPSKLRFRCDHPVAVMGASLTAIDAIRTLSRWNGTFTVVADNKRRYERHPDSPQFKIVMHSRNGLLPAVRFHLEDSHLHNNSMLSRPEIEAAIIANNGFLSLDYIFERDFKALFIEKDTSFYERIKDLTLEEFVDRMMGSRERMDPFKLLKSEYVEAERSISRHESVYWKELLAELSFAMNYPAKYFSAEDMLRLQTTLMPLISVVIAFIPQGSCEELLALREAGILELITVGKDSIVVPELAGGITYEYTDDENRKQAVHYETFVDCTGQKHLPFDDFPFTGLKATESIAPATLNFQSDAAASAFLAAGNKNVLKTPDGYVLTVPGIAINDSFQVLDADGLPNDRIYVMTVPFIGGYNPDYSGLDFCEEASYRIANTLLLV
ncbi:MAG: hypothetical protein CFE23_15770 [Flavobacterium sp. BFFFF1]|uniref:FAD/NAD(P)-binding protein n=1 Tax=Flavobacterium sp. BFFFF1 TaxID=2015557 RepID=UPI000BD01BF3|nr:FAD/NAD(P)-binding protein [Flavobacterium sp. BFFFF1]OYU79069.1 MAG: hypothetical protein CFE23_15770 [Flavobacterium sp. BFFFF1]